MTERTVLLGVDHADYGAVRVVAGTDGRTAAAISIGGDYVRMRKGDLPVPNEDAVAFVDDGARTLLVVCDGHAGHWASHGFAEALAEIPVPPGLLELHGSLRSLVQPVAGRPEELPDGLLAARSTLLLAVVDRARGRLFGLSYGDSSLFVLRGDELPARCNRKNDHFVGPWSPRSLAERAPSEFQLALQPGDLVVACTDGVDECHYHRPETSVGPAHLRQLWRGGANGAGGAGAAVGAAEFAGALARLALRGVDGHPGGQDNVAIVATSLA